MELWLETEVQMRRDAMLRTAREARLIASLRSRRSSSGGVRGRIADAAQVLSEALATLARTLRNGETV
jgi:hypothetical protein